MTNAVKLGLSVTLCIVLLVVLTVTAILLYKQVKKNQKAKRLREERMRKQQQEEEEAFQPVGDIGPLPTISGSVSSSMTSLIIQENNKDDGDVVPDSRRDPYLYVYDNPATIDPTEDSVRFKTDSSKGGRRAQRVSYTRSSSSSGSAQNGQVVTSSSKMDAQPLPVSPTAYQNAGYGSLGLEGMCYTHSAEQLNNVHQYRTNPAYGAVSTPSSRGMNANGAPRQVTSSVGTVV